MGDVATLLGGADELYGRIGEADQSRPGALHAQANGREDDRDQCEPPGADLTTRCDHEPDYGGTRRLSPRPRSSPIGRLKEILSSVLDRREERAERRISPNCASVRPRQTPSS